MSTANGPVLNAADYAGANAAAKIQAAVNDLSSGVGIVIIPPGLGAGAIPSLGGLGVILLDFRVAGTIGFGGAPQCLDMSPGGGQATIRMPGGGMSMGNSGNSRNNLFFTDAGETSTYGSLTVGKALIRTKQTPVFAASPAPDPTAGDLYAMAALTGAVTVANPVNSLTGMVMRFIWTQDGTGGRTVTYSGANWRSVGIAAQTTTLSTVTIDDATCIDGTIWRVNRLVTGQTI